MAGSSSEYSFGQQCTSSIERNRAETQIAIRSNNANIRVDSAKPDVLILYEHSNEIVMKQLKTQTLSNAEQFSLYYTPRHFDRKIGVMPFEIKAGLQEAYNQLVYDVGSILCHRDALGMAREPVYGGTLVSGIFKLWLAQWLDREVHKILPFILSFTHTVTDIRIISLRGAMGTISSEGFHGGLCTPSIHQRAGQA
jgi:hypothetical protein